MPLVVGVSFRKVGKVYYFDPGDIELQKGDFIITETAHGVEFGEVVIEPREVPEEELVAPLKKIIRVAGGDDLQREAGNREKEKQAYEICERKIAEHGLPMKLLEAEYAFDGSQVTFSFSADGRIDFRELVKDVAGALRTKVQLHQIGVRDEARLIGGFGPCGRSLCCATFLTNFEPISMKMAKDQSLFLNPAKFSGTCGKLMCCLRYEHDYYKLAQKQFPMVGAVVPLENGVRAKVVDVNVVNGMLTVQTEDEVLVHIHAGQINLEGLCRRHGIACNLDEKGCSPLGALEHACGQSCCGSCGGHGADEIEVEETEELQDDWVDDTEDVVVSADDIDTDVISIDTGVKWRTPRGEDATPDNAVQATEEKPVSDEKSGGNGNGKKHHDNRRRDNRRPNGNRRGGPRNRPRQGRGDKPNGGQNQQNG